MTTRLIAFLILLLSLLLGCGQAYAQAHVTPTLIDGNAQVKLDDAIRVLVFICATIITAAGTIVALAFWAGSRFQQINDDIRALRAEIGGMGGIGAGSGSSGRSFNNQ